MAHDALGRSFKDFQFLNGRSDNLENWKKWIDSFSGYNARIMDKGEEIYGVPGTVEERLEDVTSEDRHLVLHDDDRVLYMSEEIFIVEDIRHHEFYPDGIKDEVGDGLERLEEIGEKVTEGKNEVQGLIEDEFNSDIEIPMPHHSNRAGYQQEDSGIELD